MEPTERKVLNQAVLPPGGKYRQLGLTIPWGQCLTGDSSPANP